MGWVPSDIRRKACVLRYWNRLVTMEDYRLTKQIFDAEFSSGYGKWCKSVRSILQECNMSYLYDTKCPVDVNACRDIMLQNFTQNWHKGLNAKPKLRTYRAIKEEYKTEKYVLLNLERNQRSILAQLRFGILPIHIETGRFTNKKVEARTCSLCNNEEVEDELHFSLSCPYYENERSQFINKLDVNLEYFFETDQLKYLFESEPRKFAKFLIDIWTKRKGKLYN